MLKPILTDTADLEIELIEFGLKQFKYSYRILCWNF